MTTYVIARAKHRRPTLQHVLSADRDYTVCGQYIAMWSRGYMSRAIPEVLCVRCKRIVGGK